MRRGGLFIAVALCLAIGPVRAQRPVEAVTPPWHQPSFTSPTERVVTTTADNPGMAAAMTRPKLPMSLSFLSKPWKAPRLVEGLSFARTMAAPRPPRAVLAYYGPATDSWPDWRASRQIDPYLDESSIITPIAGISRVPGFEDTCTLEDDLNTTCVIKLNFSCGGGNPGACDDLGGSGWTGSINNPALQDINVKFYVRGVAITGWVGYPFTTTLTQSDSAFSTLCNGDSDLSLDVQSNGDDRSLFTYIPMRLHYWHAGHSDCTDVPLMARSMIYQRAPGTFDGFEAPELGPRFPYVTPPDPTIVRAGHPAATGLLLPWHDTGPLDSPLYQEEMAPHTTWPTGDVFPWQYSSVHHDAGKTYYRARASKDDEDHQTLYTQFRHDVYFTTDGPRGVCTASPYITGFVDTDNDFYFVQIDGALREMHEDGECETIAGYRVKAGKFPVWPEDWITNAQVRENEDFVGCVVSGSWIGTQPYNEGMHTPLDVAPGPDGVTFYVAGYYDNAIIKVVEGAGTCDGHVGESEISTFAGSTSHTVGHADGTGTAATFNHPSSIAYDAVCDCYYIADQDNSLIRKMTPAGVVTTLPIGSYTAAALGAIDRFNDDSASLTGAIDTTAGSATVTCHTTCAFLTQLYPHALLEVTGVELRIVETVTDNTTFTLTHVASSTSTNHAYFRKGISGANVQAVAAFNGETDTPGIYTRAARGEIQLSSTLKFTVNSTDAGNGVRADICLPMTVRTGSDGDLYVLDQCYGSIRRINPSTWVTTYIAGPFQRFDSDGSGRGWTWFDVDKWGNSGFLDQVYYLTSQGSFLDGAPTLNRTNEEFGWAKADGSTLGLPVFNDGQDNPDGFGDIAATDPPHYGWLVAVAPSGGVYFAGFGEHGITRIRVKDSNDTEPATFGTIFHYGTGKKRFKNGGGNNGAGTFTMSTQLIHGTNAHNYISDFGYADAWDYGCNHAVSDATLIDDFHMDETKIRAAAGGGSAGSAAVTDQLDLIRTSFGRCVTPAVGDTPGAQRIVPRFRIRGVTFGDNSGDHKGGRK